MSFRLRGLILFEHKGIEFAKMGSALPKDVKKGSGVQGSTFRGGLSGFGCHVSGILLNAQS